MQVSNLHPPPLLPLHIIFETPPLTTPIWLFMLRRLQDNVVIGTFIMHDWTWTHNDLVPKWTLNHSVKLAKQTLIAKLAETSDIAPVSGNYKNAYVKRVRDMIRTYSRRCLMSHQAKIWFEISLMYYKNLTENEHCKWKGIVIVHNTPGFLVIYLYNIYLLDM